MEMEIVNGPGNGIEKMNGKLPDLQEKKSTKPKNTNDVDETVREMKRQRSLELNEQILAFNENFSEILIGPPGHYESKVKICYWPDGREKNPSNYRFLSVDTFKIFTAHMKYFYLEEATQRRKKGKLSKLWLEDPRRERLHGIVFRPDLPKDICSIKDFKYLNLWKGFAVIERGNDDDWACYKKLLMAAAADEDGSENKEVYDYLICLLAYVVQFPSKLPKAAIVLRGNEGSGKSRIPIYLSKIFHSGNVLIAAERRDLTGQFNDMLVGRKVAFFDESFFSANNSTMDKLKRMVTEETFIAEGKFLPRYSVDNKALYFMATNHELPVQVTEGDRRFLTLVLNKQEQFDRKFWDEFHDEMDGNGPAALLNFLLSVKLKGFSPLNPPVNQERKALKEATKFETCSLYAYLERLKGIGYSTFW